MTIFKKVLISVISLLVIVYPARPKYDTPRAPNEAWVQIVTDCYALSKQGHWDDQPCRDLSMTVKSSEVAN